MPFAVADELLAAAVDASTAVPRKSSRPDERQPALRNQTSSDKNLSRVWRTVIADGHPLMLRGVRAFIARQPDFRVVATSTDGALALQLIRDNRPDLAVLDIRMPKLSGFDVLAAVVREQIDSKVIFLTSHLTNDEIVGALAAGARGIVLKEAAPGYLMTCLREVARGALFFPSELLGAAASQGGRATQLRLLTGRELQVAKLVAQGLTNGEIANELALTEGTVKIHLHNIFEKLGIANRSVLTALMLDRRRTPR